MSTDARTRALERDMDPEAAGALLRERIRVGEVPERHVRLAAWLGYPPALAAAEPLETRDPPSADWLIEKWIRNNKVSLACAEAITPTPGCTGRVRAYIGHQRLEIPWGGPGPAWREWQFERVAEVLCWGPPVKREHKPDCRWAMAAGGPVAIECEHGRDACSICDPCCCWGPPS